jgi:hypothetical protein
MTGPRFPRPAEADPVDTFPQSCRSSLAGCVIRPAPPKRSQPKERRSPRVFVAACSSSEDGLQPPHALRRVAWGARLRGRDLPPVSRWSSAPKNRERFTPQRPKPKQPTEPKHGCLVRVSDWVMLEHDTEAPNLHNSAAPTCAPESAQISYADATLLSRELRFSEENESGTCGQPKPTTFTPLASVLPKQDVHKKRSTSRPPPKKHTLRGPIPRLGPDHPKTTSSTPSADRSRHRHVENPRIHRRSDGDSGRLSRSARTIDAAETATCRASRQYCSAHRDRSLYERHCTSTRSLQRES